ncbi:serine protease 56 isoform X2 [Sander lucioperca]|uniref:serine protease 56 isoform X2 n=1 Tax=Sander lucioperca TaxID=283035 RepID=UPI001653792C|nr:serine protease 56 isoform X2 [Sander lucioperca]
MLLLISLLLMGLDCLPLGAPTGREVYRMPQSALKALSDRGTVVLEAAMTSALSSLERASSERSQAEAGCRGCAPCLFQDCGQLSGSCSSPANALSEPICDVISKAQKLQDEAERSWALSQACAYYQHRCPPGELDKETCIRIMAVCGQRSSTVQNITQPRSRIVGGSPAPPGSWPWLVNLQLDGGLMCGGVLVDSSWVVTAAHCFAGSRSESYWTAVVGEFDITKTDPDEQLLKVNRVIPHPKFNPKTFNNDIALVELTSPVVLSSRVTPVCLPSGMEPPTGSPCLVAGWGSLYEDGPSADVVMEAKVPLLPQSTCKSALGKELVTNTMLCAGYLSGGIDSCQGDSGGPLIYQDRISGRFQLYGITSWGDGCGEKGKPGVYTRVSAFSDWIQTEIQKSFGSREPTCPELLKTTEMTEEEQRSEFSSICRFYTLTCPPGQSASACSRMAEDKCLTRFKKCQLRSFLQTLLDLLQRAEDYIRDKVDLTFFTKTLPQLVEHIYSTAFTHTRERRDLGLSHGLTQIKEQLGGAVVPTEQGPSPVPPALFREVGPSVDDWEKYLRNMAEDLDKQHTDTSTDISSTPTRQEDNLFLQTEDSSVHQLEGQFQSVISALRSKLYSRAAPPILHLDTVYLQEDSPNSPPLTTSSTGAPVPSSSSSSQESQEPWSLLTALMNEFEKLSTQDEIVTEDVPQSQTSSNSDASPDVKWSTTSEDFTFVEHEDGTELKSSALPLPVQSTSVVQPGNVGAHTETTADPRQAVYTVKTFSLHRKYRSLLRKRQIPGAGVKICPGVRESSQQVNQVRDSYSWVLSIPSKNLRMNFQEVLVDLSSKNDRGLYQARVRAVVGGRPLTFYSLVGLENESFYRSVPRIIALALEALKT